MQEPDTFDINKVNLGYYLKIPHYICDSIAAK
jgi:hypothetical protein